MVGWRAFWERRATWPLLLAAVAAQSAFTYAFLAGETSAWGRAVAAGDGRLPEELPGLPAVEPGRSLMAIWSNDGVGDYVGWQALDVPFAALNVLLTTAAISLFLRKANPRVSAARLLLLLPLIYFTAEMIENALLALFALKAVPAEGTAALAQQAATTIKLGAGFGAMAAALAGVVGAGALDICRLLKRR